MIPIISRKVQIDHAHEALMSPGYFKTSDPLSTCNALEQMVQNQNHRSNENHPVSTLLL